MTSWVDGELVGFDLETTSADPAAARPVSYSLVRYSGRRIESATGGFVDPGIPIPAGASAVHGITDATLAAADPVDLDDGIATIRQALVAASRAGVPVVGMNLKYDLAVIDANARRVDREGLVEGGWNGPVLDILVIDRALDRYRKGKRTLSSLAVTYGVALDHAHEASADVHAAVEVLFAIADRYPDELAGRPLDDIYALQKGWHRDWARGYSEWLTGQGRPPLPDAEAVWPLAPVAPPHRGAAGS
jgi:DNA polymerase-3 subunit epsilon